MEAAATKQRVEPLRGVSSFAKSLFLGEIHEDLVFPFPRPDDDEQRKIRSLTQSLREWAETYDDREAEERGWVGDDAIAELGERGLLGLYVP
jgi:alkylation response protein AidB-like acyl-CoA dehydrogenase